MALVKVTFGGLPLAEAVARLAGRDFKDATMEFTFGGRSTEINACARGEPYGEPLHLRFTLRRPSTLFDISEAPRHLCQGSFTRILRVLTSTPETAPALADARAFVDQFTDNWRRALRAPPLDGMPILAPAYDESGFFVSAVSFCPTSASFVLHRERGALKRRGNLPRASIQVNMSPLRFGPMIASPDLLNGGETYETFSGILRRTPSEVLTQEFIDLIQRECLLRCLAG